MDQLGFVSDKYTIELRIPGIKFPTILPPALSNDKPLTKEKTLRLCDNVFLPTGVHKNVEVGIAGLEKTGKTFWVSAGPACPDDVIVTEGILNYDNGSVAGRGLVSIMSMSDQYLGPDKALFSVRAATEADEQLLERIRNENDKRCYQREQLEACHAEANEKLLQQEKPEALDRFLKTSYKTRGQKERKELLFPELVEEIAEKSNAMKKGVLWPDQTSDSYKKECSRVASQKIGKQLNKTQVGRFVTCVVCAFSAVFLDGRLPCTTDS